MGGAQAQLPPDSWTPSGEMAYTGPVFVPNGAEKSHVWSVVCLSGFFLPLRLPYQFLPLPLLGLSVEVEKSERHEVTDLTAKTLSLQRH